MEESEMAALSESDSPKKRPCQGRTPYARCHPHCPLSQDSWEEREVLLLDRLITGQLSVPREYFIHKVYTHALTMLAYRNKVSDSVAFDPVYDEVFSQLLADRIQELGSCERFHGICEQDPDFVSA